MQRLVIVLLIGIIGFASWKLGLWVGESNLRSVVLSRMQERPEWTQLQKIADGVNASGTMKADVFVDIVSVREALVGIRYTVLSKEADIYEAEPQRYYYEVRYDKKTRQIEEVSPYAKAVN